MIIVTQLLSHQKMSVDPESFIFHQPRRIQLDLPGKRAFQKTTIMSVYSPQFAFQICEEYEQVSKGVMKAQPGQYAEWTHGETGTRFLCAPKMFALFEVGCATGFTTADHQMELTQCTSIVSVMNPAIWVPIKESFLEAQRVFGPVLSWSVKPVSERPGPAWGFPT